MAPIRRESLQRRALRAAAQQRQQPNSSVNPDDNEARLVNQQLVLAGEVQRIDFEHRISRLDCELQENRRLYVRYEYRYLLARNRLRRAQREIRELRFHLTQLIANRNGYSLTHTQPTSGEGFEGFALVPEMGDKGVISGKNLIEFTL